MAGPGEGPWTQYNADGTLKPGVEPSSALPGVAKAAASGLRSGIESIPAMGGNLADLVQRITGKVTGAVTDKETGATVGEGAGDVMRAAASPWTPVIQALAAAGIMPKEYTDTAQKIATPTSADVGAATDYGVSKLPADVAGPVQDITRHVPQGGMEEMAATGASFLPAAALPGGLLTRAARVAAPTVAVEGVSKGFEHFDPQHKLAPEVEELTKLIAGAVAGGGVEAVRGNLATSSAFKKLQTTPAAAERLRTLLHDSGMTPEDATAAMRELGIESTPMDVSPNVQQEAQRVQAAGGPGRGVIDPMLRARELEKNRRLMEDVGATVGPREQPGDIEAALKTRKEAVGSQYPAAKANQSMPSDLQPIADALDAEIVNSRGGMKSSLQAVRDMLDIPGAKGNLDPSAGGVHGMREELDRMIKGETPGSPLYARLTDIRKQIDAQLKGIAPDIKALDEQYSQASKEGRAFEEGQKTFENPRGAPTEVEFKQAYDSMSPGEQEHILKGLNVETYRQLGINGNDLTTLQKILKGDGKWNHEKVAAVIGEDKATRLMDAVSREKTFNETYQKVIQGSKTAATQPDVPARGRLSRMISSFKQSSPAMLAAQAIDPSGFTAGAVGGTQAVVEGLKSGVSGKVRPGDLDIAKLMTTNDPTLIQQAVAALERNRSRPGVPTMLSALLARQRRQGDEGRR